MEEARQGQSFYTASASWLPHISGGGGVDEMRVAEVLNFSILWAGTKEQLFKVHRSCMVKSPKWHGHWYRTTQSWEAGPGTWGARRNSFSGPKDSVERVGSDGVLSCRQKPLAPSPHDASITQASPGGNAS